MRLLFIHDTKITKTQLDKLTTDFTDFVKQYTGITPMYFYMPRDFSDVPTEPDSDGDLKPTDAYARNLADAAHSVYGQWGIDSIVMLVHRDNWVFTGIWGTNWSNKYYQYHVHLCRFDSRNSANSLGTLYHEWMHSLDALIKTHTGFDINTLFKGEKCFVNWDVTCIHGNRTSTCKETEYSYIKWKDNTKALVRIAPYLQQAYAKRKQMYYAPYVTVLWQAVDILRSLLNKKNGVSPSITK